MRKLTKDEIALEMERRLDAASRERRAKNFRVEVAKSRYPDSDELTVSITTNGRNWTTLCYYRDEAEKVIAALREYLDATAPKRCHPYWE